MKKKILFIGLFLTMLLASCSTQQSAISELRTFSHELEMNSENYTLSEWSSAGKQYYVINKRIKKHASDYSDSETQEIAELNGKCVRMFAEGAKDKASNALEMVKSFIGGFLNK